MLKLVLPIVFFIIIFVVFGFDQEAKAASVTFTVDTTIITDEIIAVGETWTINPGVTVTFAPGKNLINYGSLINDGTLILIGDSSDLSGNLQNLGSSTFTNSGTITVTGDSGIASGSIAVYDTSSLTNTGTVIIIGNDGKLSGFLSLRNTGKIINNGLITLTGGNGEASGIIDNWHSANIVNIGTITITGNNGKFSASIWNMGTSSITNNGVISSTGGNGKNSGQIVNSEDAKFENLKTITILSGGPLSNSIILTKDNSQFTNRGTITLDRDLVNKASLTNFNKLIIGNDLDNQGKTSNICGTITINGILIGNAIIESKCSGGSDTHEDPTIGKSRHGIQVVENGICIDIKCWTVTADYHQDFELVELLSDSAHTISTTVYCQSGVVRCNYVAFGVSPYGTNINDSVWKIILQKDLKNNWSMTVIDPDGYLGDVTSTTQLVNDEKNLAVSVTAVFKKPTPGMILNVETRDSLGGYRDFKFNDGIEIKDKYAYPYVETSYDPPLKIKPLCLNENPNKRYTCAFDLVRQWTIKNAEITYQEIMDKKR